jgi:hypothetical protein
MVALDELINTGYPCTCHNTGQRVPVKKGKEFFYTVTGKRMKPFGHDGHTQKHKPTPPIIFAVIVRIPLILHRHIFKAEI